MKRDDKLNETDELGQTTSRRIKERKEKEEKFI